STLSRLADRLRRPRYWPTTLAIIAVAMALAALAVVTVYRLALAQSWRPDHVFAGLLSDLEPTADEEVAAGALEIVTAPDGAVVYVNGVLQEGRTPLWVSNLAVGVPHVVVLSMDGRESIGREVVLSGARLERLSVMLPPGRPTVLPPDAPPAGSAAATVDEKTAGFLTLESEPAVEVFVAGRKIGNTPLLSFAMPPGVVVVELRNDKLGFAKTLRLRINRGETLRRRVIGRKGQIAVEVRPWAEVYLGQRKLGTTPMAPLSLYEGSYALRLKNSELAVERVVQVSVRPGRARKLVERLK
ncbi:MAG: PEGA domain-containing protein, partial [Deltaproteobacteria bacterium]|nr:PEGA domain-containing protein [Deltaproteobacteria bacterium]